MGSLHGCLPLHIRSHASNRWRRFLRRCCRPSQLDIQYSAVQCKLLLTNPSRLYSLAALRQKQQQSCAREDPAFLLLLLLLLLITGIGHAAALQAAGAATFAAVAAAPLCAFVLSALVVIPLAFFCHTREVGSAVTAGVLPNNDSSSSSSGIPTAERTAGSSGVPPFDFAYAFDLHCNAIGKLRSAAPLWGAGSLLVLAVIACSAAGAELMYCPARLVLLLLSDTAPAEHAAAAAAAPAAAAAASAPLSADIPLNR
ncbi:hypothetical protein, conserved [Eimeria acervulina]|uniref:Uncharacterized protein n=1 Tax=Eimeria acervulina TaxID=5801 RepID=U6GGH2_EIMAC|nr:hypothetical protein, conserved [Eimeria acervulina]CDI78393.1 hypothetical protein, conserved [Eimeria acervulina]